MLSVDRTIHVWQSVESWTPQQRRAIIKVRAFASPSRTVSQTRSCRRYTILRGSTFSSSTTESLSERFEESLVTAPLTKPLPWWSSPYDAQILQFAIPLLLSCLIIPLTSAIDIAVVGRLGTAQLSGVALGNVTISLLNSCLTSFPILIAPYVARNCAAKKDDEVSSYVVQVMKFSVGLGIALAALVFSQTNFIISLLKPAATVRPFAATYLKWATAIIPGSLCSLCCMGVLRGLKDSTSILKSSLFTCIINAVLDCVFVFGFGWSVRGAALATAISIYTTLGFLLRKLFLSGIVHRRDFLKLPNIRMIRPFIGEGLRLSLRSILLVGMLSLSTTLISRNGPVIHAAYELCQQFAMFAYMVCLALEQTVQALSAGASGANDLEEARGIIHRTMQMSFTVTATLVMILIVFSTQVARVFVQDPAVIATFARTGVHSLAVIPICSVVYVVNGALMGASRIPMVALSQASGYFLAILALLGLNQAGFLNVAIALSIIRVSVLFSGFITVPFLFSSRWSPYGFSLLP